MLTRAHVHAIATSAAVLDAAAALVAAQARAAQVAEEVAAIAAPIFSGMAPWPIPARYREGRRAMDAAEITDPGRLYLSDEADKAEAYYAAVQAANAAAGWDVPEGQCPALRAEEDERKATVALLVAIRDATGGVLDLTGPAALGYTSASRGTAAPVMIRDAAAAQVLGLVSGSAGFRVRCDRALAAIRGKDRAGMAATC